MKGGKLNYIELSLGFDSSCFSALQNNLVQKTYHINPQNHEADEM